MVTFSGFYESHKPPSLGDAHGILPSHHHGHQNNRQSGYILINVLFAVALAAAWAIQSE
jgi:hypothetical protein